MGVEEEQTQVELRDNVQAPEILLRQEQPHDELRETVQTPLILLQQEHHIQDCRK